MDETVRVLGVDDDPDFTTMAATFIEREDDRFDVETATSASEALERLADERFDCVVSDYEMPGADGIEFLESVRAADAEVPFILFTGRGSEAVASEAISAGVTDYLQKESGTDQFTVLANRIANAVEHDRTRQRAERGEKRLRKIVDTLPHLLYVVDREGTYLLANEALATFHGAAVEDIEDASVAAVLDDAAHEQVMRDVERTLESDGVERIPPSEVEDSRGNTHVIEPRMVPYDLAETDGRAVLGIGTDVTERVQRERRLNVLAERFEALHEATRDLVRAEDEETVARIVADAVREVFEYANVVVRLRDEDRLEPVVVTKSAREDLGDRPAYTLDEGLPGNVYQSGEPRIVEDFRELDDGIDRGSHRSGLYLPIGDHGTLSVGHTEPDAFDQSDRSLAQVLVTNAAAVLDRLGGEAELRRQHGRLETFVNVVSHDLRNPLTVAQSALHLARDDCDSEHLETVAEAQERIATLFDDMGSLARAGTVADEMEPIDLSSLARTCWCGIDPGDAALVNEDETTVIGDERRVRQLLVNLFRNAIQHGDEAATVRIGPQEGGFFVADDGAGIPDQDRERVFDTGFSTAAGGTGIGLAIVRDVADAHGWSVAVTTGADGGTRFEFTDVETQ